jgi:chromosome segregation ATPase
MEEIKFLRERNKVLEFENQALRIENRRRQASVTKLMSEVVDLRGRVDNLLARVDGLSAENHKLKQQLEQKDIIIDAQAKTIAEQKNTIDDLKRKLGINSDNSNLPPSKNPLHKPRKIMNNREMSDKNSGGQVGHRGKTLEFSKYATHEIEHKPQKCKGCGGVNLYNFTHAETRQVHDVQISKTITNHMLYKAKCACGCTTKAPHCNSKCKFSKNLIIRMKEV